MIRTIIFLMSMPIYLDHRRIQNKRITIKILITIRIISSDLSQRSRNSTSRLQQGSEVWVVALGKMFETLTIIFVGLEFFLEGGLTNIVVARKNVRDGDTCFCPYTHSP